MRGFDLPTIISDPYDVQFCRAVNLKPNEHPLSSLQKQIAHQTLEFKKMAIVHPFVPVCHVYYGYWDDSTTCNRAWAKMPKIDAAQVYSVNPTHPVGDYNLPVTYEDSECKLNTALLSHGTVG